MKTLKEYLVITESIDLKDSHAKKIQDLKQGDTLWGINLEYVRNPKPELVLATVISLKPGKDVSEYYGGSELKVSIDGKERIFTFWERELNGCIYNSGTSKFFTSKKLRDKYLQEQIPEDIKRINREFDIRDQWSKEALEKQDRFAKGEFKSLEEEIGWIEDQYDHEYGSAEMNRKMDAECDALIAAAKKKWGNK